MINLDKNNDLSDLRAISMSVRSDAEMIKDYMEFMCKQLIEIKYDLKEIKSKGNTL